VRCFEKLDGEKTAKAYRALTCFRDLGPKRTLKKAAQTYYGTTSNLRQVAEWSPNNDWVARAQAYDEQRVKKPSGCRGV